MDYVTEKGKKKLFDLNIEIVIHFNNLKIRIKQTIDCVHNFECERYLLSTTATCRQQPVPQLAQSVVHIDRLEQHRADANLTNIILFAVFTHFINTDWTELWPLCRNTNHTKMIIMMVEWNLNRNIQVT